MKETPKEKNVPATSKITPLTGEELQRLFRQLEEGWELIDEKQIVKEYRFKNFKEALAFVNDIGKIAEEEEHHPDISLSWGKVTVLLWTHKIGGLSKKDFLLAEKCDVAFTSRIK
ncbi:MAG: putative pterin-4-alpha-carbinolamine dehydratase [Chlamydiae bacterium]|nr:putative pterin-4-alpha-carbinolamine dehydratase [Chlamydiota bacterium]